MRNFYDSSIYGGFRDDTGQLVLNSNVVHQLIDLFVQAEDVYLMTGKLSNWLHIFLCSVLAY